MTDRSRRDFAKLAVASGVAAIPGAAAAAPDATAPLVAAALAVKAAHERCEAADAACTAAMAEYQSWLKQNPEPPRGGGIERRPFTEAASKWIGENWAARHRFLDASEDERAKAIHARDVAVAALTKVGAGA